MSANVKRRPGRSLVLWLSMFLTLAILLSACDTNDQTSEPVEPAPADEAVVEEAEPATPETVVEDATDDETVDDTAAVVGDMDHNTVRVSELMDYNVQNFDGEGLGEIEDVMIGLDADQANYAIFASGEFLDMGGRLYAIPLNAFQYDPSADEFVLNIDEEAFDTAPGFDANAWPDATDPTWDDESLAFWQNREQTNGSTSPQVMPAASTFDNTTASAIRASELIDLDLQTMAAEDAGEIEDILIDMATNQITYLIVSPDGAFDLTNEFYAIPPSQFSLDANQGIVTFNADPTMLNQAPGFNNDAWPDFALPDWDMDTRTFWENDAAMTVDQPTVADAGGDEAAEAAFQASDLLDYHIQDATGEVIGEVEDMVIGLDSSHVNYAIINLDQMMDLDPGMFYAVPFNALTAANEEGFMLTNNELIGSLQTAPTFDNDTWPDLTNPEWDADIRSFWDSLDLVDPATEPATAEMAQSAMAEPAVRASTLIDYDVENSAGEGLGEIEDLMIGRNSGDVKYAVLGFGGFLDLGEKFFAIPLSAISLNPQDNNAIFDVPEETLENAPGFDTDNWPDTADPQWDMDTRNFWRDNVASPTGDIDAADRADQEITTDMGGDELVNEAGLRASELIGYNVFNSAGEELGEIDDLMVGFDSEQINYVILETGGFLDLGEQLFVIPVQAISVDPGQEQVLLDVNEEIFDNAPGFQAAEWPDFTQPDWDIDYWSYWNDSQLIPQDSMITPNQRESAIRASDLMGFNVVNAQDEDLGEIEDLVIGFDSHQIRYGVLSFGGFLGLGEEWVAVPLHMMTLTPAEEEVILDVTPETIEAAPRFTDDEWPDLNTPDWDLDYQQYWGPEVVR